MNTPSLGSHFMDVRNVLNQNVRDALPLWNETTLQPHSEIWNQIHTFTNQFERGTYAAYDEA